MSKHWGSWRARLLLLIGDQRGGVMMIVGLAIIPLFAMIGLAIDGGRGYMLKSKLSYAIDAAGLAGGRAFDTDLREAGHHDVLQRQFPARLPGVRAAAGKPGDHVRRRGADDHDRGHRDDPDPVHAGRRHPRHDRHRAHRGQARAPGHGAGPGDGQYRLDARQRRHGGDEAGRDHADRHPLRRSRGGAEPLGRRRALLRLGQHRDPARGLADRLRPDRLRADHVEGLRRGARGPNDSNDATPATALFTPLRWATTLNQYANPYHVAGAGTYNQNTPAPGASI